MNKNIKIFSFVCAITAVLSTSLGTTYADSCTNDFTAKQTQTVQNIQTFLSKNQEAIAGLFAQDENMQVYISAQISDVLRTINGIFYCYSDEPVSYAEFQKDFSVLVQKIIVARKTMGIFDQTSLGDGDTAILLLQKHLSQLIQMGLDTTKPFTQQSSTKVEGFFDDPESDTYISGSLVLQGSGLYDYTNTGKFVSQMKVDTKLFIRDEENNPVDLGVYADLEVRKANHMYINIHDMNLKINSPEVSSDPEYAMFSTMMQSVFANIKNQNIMIDGDMSLSAEEFTKAFQQGLQFVQGVSKTPIIKFYSVQDGKLWGMLTPAVCDMMPMFAASSDCTNMVYDLMLASKGKGYLVLSQSNGTYTLTFDPMYMPVDAQTIKGMKATWDSLKITNIQAPFGKNQDGYISYDNGYRKGSYSDEEGKFTLSTVDKTPTTKLVTAEISLVEDNMRMVLSREQQPSVANGNTIRANVQMFQDEKQVLSLSLDHQQAVQYVQSLSILDPVTSIPVQQVESTLMGFMFPTL